ncbi:macrophage-expressed gene 1 protein-like [Engraulis encrasicolus]|uniref:macrophage-expressed gene 1 protein-like n=1 Tax=Engraulis encrasicolus TaxID=184585 RepID=UPI002FD3E728
MALHLVLTYLVLALSSISGYPLSHQSNGLRECRSNGALRALEVLPGGGWDNLRNLDMGRVMNFSYSQCQTTEDGVYLIPDEVFVIPQKVSRVETNSDIITSWLDQRSTTSRSINAEASFFPVLNGKFSLENERMKTHQDRESSVTAHVQVRNHLYTVKAYPGFTLDSRFTHQAMEIADAIENNQTRLAAYLSEKLILHYGTHVITTIEAGASLVMEEYLQASYVSNVDKSTHSVSASAGQSFFNKVNFKIGSKDVQGNMSNYEGNVTYSLTVSHGGAPFYPGITLQKWQESIVNNLAAIDRTGMPLHYFITKAVFPNMPEPTVGKLAWSVRQAVKRYYTVNTRPGCVKPDSKNFNFQANVDDGSCEGPATNPTFGGIYQRCTQITEDGHLICEVQGQNNPETGNYTCQEPYQETLLRSQMMEEGYTRYECHQECEKCWLIQTCCKNVCSDVYRIRRANIETYWCSTVEETETVSGFLFGGLYSPSMDNPLTKSRSCPPQYNPLKLLTTGLMLCLSKDYEAGTRFSVPFGGFFSCEAGNPLMGCGQRRCPPNFSQHLAAISDGCEVLYCVQSGIFTGGQLLPIHLPPFTCPPIINGMTTDTVVVITEGDKAWVRVNDTNMWKMAKAFDVQGVAEQMNNY